MMIKKFIEDKSFKKVLLVFQKLRKANFETNI